MPSACNHFNPRSPRGERLKLLVPVRHRAPISIHAPRVGSDRFVKGDRRVPGISIHAPRVGSDALAGKVSASQIISIHAPRVGSDFTGRILCKMYTLFQSTLPAWGATIVSARYCII